MLHIIYHDDMDGWISADILMTYLSGEVILHECSYQRNNFSFKNIKNNDTVYILDYSFPPQKMKLLKQKTDLIWIDHHKSAIELSQEYGYSDVKGIRKNGKCGAQLTYEYCYGSKVVSNKFVKYVGQFDTYRNSEDRQFFHETILPFFYGFELNKEYFNPNNHYINDIYEFNNDLIESLIKQGKVVYKYNKVRFEEICNKKSFIRDAFGCRILCLNTNEKGTMVFQIPEYFDETKHDMMCIYNYDGGKWNYGFYAPKSKTFVDCSKIAMKYGGGGHKGSSGFQLDYLLQWLK